MNDERTAVPEALVDLVLGALAGKERTAAVAPI